MALGVGRRVHTALMMGRSTMVRDVCLEAGVIVGRRRSSKMFK